MICIIGAGPVGLAFALEYRSYFPSETICIFEKRETYIRNQYVFIRPNQLHFHNKQIQLKSSPTKICDIEHYLKSLCIQHNILFVNLQIHSLHQILSTFPSCKIIDASGAHSPFRQLKVDNQHFLSLQIQYIDQDIDKQLQPMSFVKLYKFFKHIGTVGFEHIHNHIATLTVIIDCKYKNKKHNFTLNCSVEEFEQTDISDDYCLKIVANYHRLRQFYGLNSGANKGTITCKIYPLSTQISKQFMNQEETIFTIGDAAVALPFFRGLQFGLMSAIQLAKSFNKHDFKKFKKWMINKSKQQLQRSNEIVEWIEYSSLYLTVSNIVPWQVIQFDEKEKELIEK